MEPTHYYDYREMVNAASWGTPKTTGGDEPRTNGNYTISEGRFDFFPRGGTMISETLAVKHMGDHYYISIGCQETIVHDKKEALKWLGKLWDEHIKEE